MFRHICTALIATLILMLALAVSSAEAQTINFDRLPNGSPVPNGTVISTQYLSLGVTFSSPAPAGGPTAGVFAAEASSPPNMLTGFHPSTQAGLYPIEMSFAAPFANWVDVTLISVGCATVTTTAYASDSTVLDRVSLTAGPDAGVGLGNRDRIALRGNGIALVRFEITATCPAGDGFGIDDVEFSLFTGAAFAAFAPTANLTLKPGTGDDTLTIKGTLSLVPETDGIHPLTEDVTILIGRFWRMIPAGGFKLDSLGTFRFTGTVGGVSLNVRLYPPENGVYGFTATAKGADLQGLASPLAVGLRIGNEGGAADLATVKVGASQ